MSKQTYFKNESENAKRLQEFIDREPPGPSRETLGLLRMKMCEAVERDQSPLVMDFAKTIASLEKTADARAIHAKEWYRPDDLVAFREVLLYAIVNEFASAPTSREKLSTVRDR